MGRLILGPADVPILGATIMRLRNRWVSDQIMEGGVTCADAIPEELQKEFHEVGSRPHHYRAFLNLLKHERRWSEARDKYPRIKLPTLLVYGDQDWAPLAERERTRALIPGVAMVTLQDAGHFLSLDQPTELADLVVRFVGTPGTPAHEAPPWEL